MLENLTPPRRVFPCKATLILEELNEQDGKILVGALKDLEMWPARTLATELKKRGVSLSADTIMRHRKGLCSC